MDLNFLEFLLDLILEAPNTPLLLLLLVDDALHHLHLATVRTVMGPMSPT